jgi:dTDP-4-amino-4,6-dideoxygalactose transaminase
VKPIWLKVAECPIREHHYQAAVQHCLRTGKVDQGEAVDRLEREVARRIGVPREWVLAVQSCTAGMGMCFYFLSGRVRAPAITWPGSYCMGRAVQWYDHAPTFENRETTVLVDLYGAAPIQEWVKKGRDRQFMHSYIVVDAAHNFLAPYHNMRFFRDEVDAVVYSFGAVKQLSGIRGGIVVSRHISEKWRAYRHYGVVRDRLPELPQGGNFDMNDFSAALILEQYKEWDTEKLELERMLRRYQERLCCSSAKIVHGGSGHLFVIWHPERDRIRDALRFEGIETSVHYKLPAWLNPFDYPKSREHANTALTLPLHSRVGLAEVDVVAGVVLEQIGTKSDRQAFGAA